MGLVESIAAAIATQEGFFTPGTRPNRNNNPGDLISWGSTPTSGGFAAFATVQDGWDALYQQIRLNISRGLSLNEFFAGKPGVYAGYTPTGQAGNSPEAYAAFVASHIGVDPNTPLNALGTAETGDTEPSDDPSYFDAGSIDWTLITALGIGLLALWWVVAD